MTANMGIGKSSPAGPRVLLELPPIGPWVDRAACKDADPELFVPTEHPNNVFVINGYRRAAAYCDRCPVVAQCNALAEASGHLGVWGGRLRMSQRRVVDLLAHLYDERWWRSWPNHRARA